MTGNRMGNSALTRLFWRLPHNLRRGLYRFGHPGERALIDRLRTAEPGQPHGPTFKPFIEHRCIFVHIPKTAGISVSTGLFGRLTGYHTTIAQYHLAFTRGELDRFFTFTVVRNPWDRLVSAFLYLKGGGINDADRQWADQHLSPFDSFEAFVQGWVNRKNVHRGLHVLPQYCFITLPGRSRPRIDFIGYFENLAEDYDLVRQRLGRGSELGRENPTAGRGDGTDFRDYYTDKTRDIVARAYREDIELLGYDFHNQGLERRLARRRLP